MLERFLRPAATDSELFVGAGCLIQSGINYQYVLSLSLIHISYTFDFGDAIQDNNEGNPLENFFYSFSTGDRLDLSLIHI